MNILLTNDDGIYADGIVALYQALCEAGHTVTVVAPKSEQSAVGHAITVSDPLQVSYVHVNSQMRGHAVKGTPADCVKLAINAILDTRPDMVLSGINRGANTGNHIIYSGTVSAATEATMFGIPSIAVSLDTRPLGQERRLRDADFTYAARFAANLCETVPQHGGLPAGRLLNVNIPGLEAQQIKGVKVAQQARFKHVDRYEKRLDPYHRVYYWMVMEAVRIADPPEMPVDQRFLKEGYIVITPIHYDLTDYDMLERLQTWTFSQQEESVQNEIHVSR